MLAQAASLGMGMALIPPFLIERELADGRLVCPLAASASSDKAYYLIIPERRREAPALQRLREWLLAEAAAYRQAQANAELSA